MCNATFRLLNDVCKMLGTSSKNITCNKTTMTAYTTQTRMLACTYTQKASKQALNYLRAKHDLLKF